MTHRHMTSRIEDALIDQDAARGGEIFEHGAIHDVNGHR